MTTARIDPVDFAADHIRGDTVGACGMSASGGGRTNCTSPATPFQNPTMVWCQRRPSGLQRYWQYAPADQDIAHAMYHDDAVLEFPQSQERFEGKANFIAWRRIYPAAVECSIRRIRGAGTFWVAEVRIRYDGGPWNYGLTLLEFKGDKVARETIYYGESWQAPEWRGPWRAAWPAEHLG